MSEPLTDLIDEFQRAVERDVSGYERGYRSNDTPDAKAALVSAVVALEAERDQLRSAIQWALGEEDEFPERPEAERGKVYPYYYWRSELRKRAYDPRPLSGERDP